MGGLSLMKRISTAFRILRGTPAEDWLAYYGPTGGGRKTKAGPAINQHSAMTISSIYAALNFLGGVVASLPLRVYRNLPDGGKEKAVEHPLYDRLHAKPNALMTSWQWIYMSLLQKYLWGNWWTWIDRGTLELVPLSPDTTHLDSRNQLAVYTRDNSGKEHWFDRGDVLLIPHVSLGGQTGKGIIHYARESLGLIKAQDEFASQFFGSGIKAGGFVEVPKETDMNPQLRKDLQEDFNTKYGGLGESWKAIFLSGGAQWKPNVIDAKAAQVLESRQFSIAEVSRWTGLTPHLLHDLSRATFSNIEELDLALVTFTLTPIVTQIEQAMNVTFLNERERQEYYVKFDLKGLLRGNLQARTAFYTAMLDRGVFHADDVLGLEDMNPQPDGLGKVYAMPLNMVNKKMILGSQSLEMQPLRAISHFFGLLANPDQLSLMTPSRQIAAPSRTILQRSSALRRKITIAYSPKWLEYAKQILGDEVMGVREGAKQFLAERSADAFITWLGGYYDNFRKKVDEQAAPLLASYADAIVPVAEQEAGSEADINVQMQAFLRDYRGAFAARHVKHSRGQLAATALEAEDAEIAVEELLDLWEKERPDQIRMAESIRAENAFARTVFAAVGVMKIRSVAYGDSCPYCLNLDGKVIGIEESFLGVGDFQPEGADRPLEVTSEKKHPPYHAGCDCGIEVSA